MKSMDKYNEGKLEGTLNCSSPVHQLGVLGQGGLADYLRSAVQTLPRRSPFALRYVVLELIAKADKSGHHSYEVVVGEYRESNKEDSLINPDRTYDQTFRHFVTGDQFNAFRLGQIYQMLVP